jgi:hypothetical protein
MNDELSTEEVDERLREMRLFGIPQYERVSELTVDQRYQRSLNIRRVKKIANEFDPYSVGMLIVSDRGDGTKVVLDGQTRRAALMQMGWEDQMVPCYVYVGLSVEEEARIFRTLNQDRARPTAIDLFRARVVERDPGALDMQASLSANGLRVASNTEAGTFRAIAAADRVYRDSGRSIFRAVISTIHAAWPSYDDPMSVSSDMVTGLGLVLAEYENDVDLSRLVKVLAQDTPANLVGKARTLRASLGGTMGSCMAQVIVHSYNKQQRTKRLQEWAQRPWRRNPLIRRSMDPTAQANGSST